MTRSKILSANTKINITENGTVFFQRILPKNSLNVITKKYNIDNGIKKLFFRTFIIFIISLLIVQPGSTSLRDMSSASNDLVFKKLSGIESVSHTAIANRLQAIPSESMKDVVKIVQRKYRKRLKHKGQTLKGMKVFDVTTFSVSSKNYQWAVKRQSRGNIRFLFVMDSYSATPDAIIKASHSTNDNTVFAEAIRATTSGKVLVFDRGFNKFQLFKQIIRANKHFITRWKKNYLWSLIDQRKINPNEKLEGYWFLESDEIGRLGQEDNEDELIVRRITCKNKKTNKLFQVITDDRNLSPAKVVKMYVLRWPIETYFRHLKSTMSLVHFPSRDPEGVYNWILMVALSVMLIELMSLSDTDKPPMGLMVRHSPFKDHVRNARSLIRRWFVLLIRDPGG